MISGYVPLMGEAKIPMELRLVIASNLKRLMEQADDEELRRAKILAARAGLGRRTINRLLNPAEYPGYAPNLETLVILADKLQAEPWEFLLPKRQPALMGVNHTRARPEIPHRNRKLKAN